MKLHKTGHPIADAVSDLMGELPDGDYKAAYGILRHALFHDGRWFEIDKGFWGAGHYGGNYRLSYRATQPIFAIDAPAEEHGIALEPWRDEGEWTMICPPTEHVCKFFDIDISRWWFDALETAKNFKEPYMCRDKSATIPIDWPMVRRVITFNSTVGIEALRRGISVISDPDHSSVGSYIKSTGCNNFLDRWNREPLFRFLQGHQFKLEEKSKVWNLIKFYLSTSDGIVGKQ